jgi:hypothetical protein
MYIFYIYYIYNIYVYILYMYINILMNVLDSFFWFQIQVLILFAWALSMTTSSLLKVGMLGCVTMDVSLPYQTMLGAISSRCLSLGFLSRMGPLWGQVFRSVHMRTWYMWSHQSLPLTGQVCDVELSFSPGRLSISAHFQFLQGSAITSFHHSAAELPHCHRANSSVHSAPPTPDSWKTFPPHIWPPVFSRGFAVGPPAKLEYVVPSKTDNVFCSSRGIADSLGWKWVSSRAPQADSSQKFCVQHVLAGPGHPRCLQVSFCCSLHCVFALLTQAGRG